MNPKPMARGLILCDNVLIEQATQKVSLIGEMGRLSASSFPARAPVFYAYSVLTAGRGHGTIQLTMTELRTDEITLSLDQPVLFPDPISEVRSIFRVQNWVIQTPGVYEFTLLVDGEWIAQRRVEVLGLEDFQ